MATFLDVGLLKFFLPIFSFIFIFAVLYAILENTKLLGENKLLHVGIAFSISFIVLFSGITLDLINFVTPWFVVLFVGLLLYVMAAVFVAGKETTAAKEEALSALGGPTVIFIIAIVIMIVGFSQVLGPVFSPFEEGDSGRTIGTETLRTLFHPRMLGALLILVISAWTVKSLSTSIKLSK